MIIPKLFRWLFFNKNQTNNVFDALRKTDSLLVDVSLDLGTPIESVDNSLKLDDSNFKEFVDKTSKERVIIIFGNQKARRMKFYSRLEAEGFEHLYDLGTLDDLKEIRNNL
ncbi:MAG: hypothetical protein ACR2MS_10485 [Weeksellaceae bacterium]